MKYRGRHQAKIIRSTYEVYITIGGGAESLKRALSHVPNGTALREIIGSETNDDITLVFEQEIESPDAKD